MGQVYGIGLPDGPVRYVGMTTKSLARRLYEHRRFAGQGKTWPLSCWLRKHPEAEIRPLEEHQDLDQLKAAEIRLIAELGTHVDQGLGGLNCTVGGTGGPQSEEVRARIRAGVVAAQEADPTLLTRLQAGRAGVPAWNKGRRGDTASAETRVRMSASHSGKPKTTNHHTRWHVNRGVTKPGCTYCPVGGV